MEPLVCPVLTPAVPPYQPEARAYKLGKKRWSYNQVALTLPVQPATGARPDGAAPSCIRQAVVRQAVRCAADLPEAHQDSVECFTLELESGAKLQAHVYLCYDAPVRMPDAGGDAQGPAVPPGSTQYSWKLVTRQHCGKGCEGRVLQAIQRFGRAGKRSSGDLAATAAEPSPGPAAGTKKDPRCMYLSIDEACTHVGASAFRLVAGVYDCHGATLLTTAVSQPIRVLANNDVPTGAACITLEAQLPADWEGWAAEAAGPGPAPSKPLTPVPAGKLASRSVRSAAAGRASARAPRGNIPRPEPSLSSCFGGTSDLSADVESSLSTYALPPSGAHTSQHQQQQRQLPWHVSLASARHPAAQAQGSCFGGGGDALQEEWQQPWQMLNSPVRQRLAVGQLPARQLARTLSLPALSACPPERADSGGGGGGGEWAPAFASAFSDQEPHSSGPRLRRRLSMPEGVDALLETAAAESMVLHSAASFQEVPGASAAGHAPQHQAHWLACAAPHRAPPGACTCGAAHAASAQQEVERQLRLLSQLKAQVLAAASGPASTGCSAGAQLQLPVRLGACSMPPMLHSCSSAGGPEAASSDSYFVPNTHRHWLVEGVGGVPDSLGLPPGQISDDQGCALHLAAMDDPNEVDMLDIASLFHDGDTGLFGA